MIFCAAGDPGGSRGLLPVITELEKRGLNYMVLDHGFLGRELPIASQSRLCPAFKVDTALDDCRVFLFGSSATDTLPLSLARQAKNKGAAVIHLLDNWSSYGRRLHHDNLKPLRVDIYAVMDDEARQGAIDDGVPPECLVITGHPGLAEVGLNLAKTSGIDKPSNKLCLAFINEPLRAVMGGDLSFEGHYGFTEDLVLKEFIRSLISERDHIKLIILPHPKDDYHKLRLWVKNAEFGLDIDVLPLSETKAILSQVDGVAGMASILLYELWLRGVPSLALQLGVRNKSITRFSRLAGMHYTDTATDMPSAVSGWLKQIRIDASYIPRPELALHQKAPETLADIICQLLAGR